jgi:PDZ domain-containing secreted protein
MKFHRRTSALVAAGLIAAGTLSVSAQQTPAGLSAKGAGTPRTATVSRTALAKMKTDALTTIQGNALNSTNGPLNNVAVRLRDARFGTIVDTQVTDKSGLFAFKSIDPGSYIVEVMANDQTVLAASQLLNVDAGQAMSAVVKLPFRIPPFAGIVGSSSVPSATAVATQAAASSIVAIVPTSPISPNK